MQSYWCLCLLLASILAAGAASRRTLRLYFVAQLIVTLAEYFSQATHYYTLVYICSTLLMVEMSVFLLWDAGISRLTWQDASLFGLWMTIVGGCAISALSLTEWYVLGEGLLFAVLGMAMLLKARRAFALLAIGTLTWAMAVYDFLWLLWPEVKAANGWLPSTMCSVAFLSIAWKGLTHGELIGRTGQFVQTTSR